MGALIWLITGIVLVSLELAVGELTLLMLGIAALGTAGVSLFDVPIWAEVITFAVLSFASLFFLKPLLRRRLHKAPVLDTSTRSLIGSVAEVLELVNGTSGQVRLDGSIWSARSFDTNTQFEVGDIIQVMTIDGTTAIVWKEN